MHAAQKGSAARKSTVAPGKSRNLSKEYVVDSDDEDDAAQSKSAKPRPKPSPAKAISTKTKPKLKPTPAVVPATASSDDESDESEDEGESGSDEEESEEDVASGDASLAKTTKPALKSALKKPDKVPPKVNGVKRSAADSASSESESAEESDEAEDVNIDEPTAKRAKISAPSKPEAQEEDSEEEDDDGSEEEDKDQHQDQDQDGKRQSVQKSVTTVPSVTTSPTLKAISAKPYKPPTGYSPLDISTSTTHSMSSLAGKQIWHVTAPSNLPLASIKEIALSALQTQSPSLTHRGHDYALNEVTASNEHERLLLLSEDGYVPAEQTISKTFHLRQVITLPDLTVKQASQVTGSSAAGNIAQASVNSIRPQPQGLRMRYKPPGSGPGRPPIGSSDSESAREPDQHEPEGASFQFPKTLGAHGVSENQKEPQDYSVASKKPKKKRKEREREDAPLNGDGDADSKVSTKKTEAAEASHQQGSAATVAATPANKVVLPETVGDDVIMTNGGASESVSKEEKARRKEEKRLKRERKEAKLRAGADR